MLSGHFLNFLLQLPILFRSVDLFKGFYLRIEACCCPLRLEIGILGFEDLFVVIFFTTTFRNILVAIVRFSFVDFGEECTVFAFWGT